MNKPERDGWLFPAPVAGAMPEPEQATELAAAAARCLSGVDGQRLLDGLVGMTLHRTAGPGLSDAALRHLEGQRALVGRGGGAVPLHRAVCSYERTE